MAKKAAVRMTLDEARTMVADIDTSMAMLHKIAQEQTVPGPLATKLEAVFAELNADKERLTAAMAQATVKL